jgi:hypothetical protein
MYKLETRNKPRGKLVREQDPHAHCVRIYPGSPDEIMLQLWSGKRYMLVALQPAEARAIGETLMSWATLIEEPRQ